jgi:hypothetical protein
LTAKGIWGCSGFSLRSPHVLWCLLLNQKLLRISYTKPVLKNMLDQFSRINNDAYKGSQSIH